MQEPTRFNLVSSTVAGPRIRRHKTCNPEVRLSPTDVPKLDCCEICGEPFIAEHVQRSELMPVDIEAMEAKIRQAAGAEKTKRAKRTRQPSRRTKVKTSLART